MAAYVELLGRARFDSQALPPDKRGCLLAYLAYEGGPVARERLALLFWPDSGEADAKRNLRQLLKRCRELPWAAGLEVSAHDVAWPIDTDVRRFRRALGREAWAEAVALYRGELLPGFLGNAADGFAAWLELERENLHGAHRTAVLRHAEALEAAGAFEAAAESLKTMLDADDLAEDILQAYLKNAYLAGQRDRALAAYERFAGSLREELGLEPLAATRQLVATIRRAVPLDAPSGEPQPRRAPLSVLRPPRLLGRARAHAAAAAAPTSVVLLRGEAGIGKSRLLEALAPGAPVLRCREGLQNVPYQPLVALVRSRLEQGVEPPELGGYLEDLVRLVPDLAPHLRPGPADPLTARARLLEALGRYLDGASKPGVSFRLAIDDLQWADGATLELLTFLSTRPGLRIVGAYRRDEVSGALAAALDGLRSDQALTLIDLHPLQEADVRHLLADLMGSEEGPPVFSQWLHRSTGGNPMFALEILKSLFEAGTLQADRQGWHTGIDELTQDYSELQVPQAVSLVIERRVAHLPEEARRVLQAAALVADTLRPQAIGLVAGLSEAAVLDGLDAATDAQFLQGGEFAHDLLRQALYAGLSEPRRRLLHARALRALEREPEGPGAALLARHATAAGQSEAAARYSLQAGDEAMAIPAYHDAAAHYRNALEHAGPNDARRHLIFEGLGDALVNLWSTAEARAAYEQALAALAGRDVLSYARLERKLSLALDRLSLPGAGLAALDDARARLEAQRSEGDANWWHEWIEVAAAHVGRQYAAADVSGMLGEIERLRQVVEAHGDLAQRGRLYHMLALLYSRQERFRLSARTVATAEKALELARQSGNDSSFHRQRFAFGFVALWSGKLQLARAHLEAGLEYAVERRDATLEMQSLTYLAVLSRLEGRIEDTEGYTLRGRELARRHAKRDYHGVARANLAWLALRRGEAARAEAEALAALAIWKDMATPAYPFFWTALLPLLAIACESRDATRAAAYAQALLEPAQMQLPEALERALRQARDALAAHDPAAGGHLLRAIELARAHRYL